MKRMKKKNVSRIQPRSFLLQIRWFLIKMIWTVLHSTVSMIWTLFEILLLCIFCDVMLGLFVLTFIFFFVYETDNKIGNDGAKAIAEALKENKTLMYLDLSCKYHTHSPLFSNDSRFDLASCVCTTTKRMKKKKNVSRIQPRKFLLQIRWFQSKWYELCCILLYPWFWSCLRYCCCVFDLMWCLDFSYSLSFLLRVWNRQQYRERRRKGDCGGFEEEHDVDGVEIAK
jgi:hypothetical protein